MRLLMLIAAILLVGVSGCARFQLNRGKSYETIKASPTRNSALAQKKHARAIVALEACDIESAHQLVNEALIADRDFGPAHNTLGKIYFEQEKYYLAAWEFEFANRMMPGRPEPINNLGLVMEAVDQFDRAVEHYSHARTLDDENPEYLGNLIRARIRMGDDPLAVQELLQDLILIETRREWADWARSLLLKAELQLDRSTKDDDSNLEEISGMSEFESGTVVESVEGKSEFLVEPLSLPEPKANLPKKNTESKKPLKSPH